MANRKLLLASPSKGGVPHHYMLLYERLVKQGIPGWDVGIAIEAAQNILTISRNILANEAIKGGYDRMIMMDLDHPVDIPHFVRILSHDHDTYPIVSALYCMKKPGNPYFLGIRAKGAKEDANHLLEARFLPTGFLSISTDALKQIAAFHPDREFYVQKDDLKPAAILPTPKVTGETMFEWFPCGVNGPRTPTARMRRINKILEPVIKKGGTGFFAKHQIQQMLDQILVAATDKQDAGYLCGEDYAASLLAYQAGVKMYLDTACVIPHRGACDYPITNPDVLATKCDPIPEHESDIDAW